MSQQNLIHMYYGDGKGKTTCSIGLAIRAAGSGMKVLFVQFMKGRDTSELRILENLENVQIFRNHKDLGFLNTMTMDQKESMKQMHQTTLEQVASIIERGDCDLLVLDELLSAYEYHLIDRDFILRILDERKAEIVVTGVNRIEEILNRADYVTNFKMEKHPYTKGIMARRGIEF